MHDKFVSCRSEGQSPIDLTGCSFAPIPGTRIALVIPGPEAELRLSAQLGIPDRLKAIRADALRNLAPGAEAFAQRTSGLGGHLYLSVSLLTTGDHWRGGWLLFHCPPGEETTFVEYLATARDAVVTDLRKERASGGSRS
jgi:hypothetical protein